MSKCTEELMKLSDKCFSTRWPIMSLWQEIAENFYPERADFTSVRNIGDDVAADLMTSSPLMMRRDLGNAIGAMLRPKEKEWFEMTAGYHKESTEEKQWLQWASRFVKRAMYDRMANLMRATKIGDHDFASFGQCALSVDMNRQRTALLFQAWHLRDIAWMENAEGQVDTFFLKQSLSARKLADLFPAGQLHASVVRALEKDPYKEFNILRVVMPTANYSGMDGAEKVLQPYVSIYIDTDHKHTIECTGKHHRVFIVPRWQLVAGSQYAHSPAAIAALPDGRLIQDMARVMLTAGEKAVDPPMVAVQEAVRGDIGIFAGGITWVDAEYDGKLREVLAPITQDRHALPFGRDMVEDMRYQLKEAWFLNKINMPPAGGTEMTAYEVGQRVQEFIRQTLPLFEPMEPEYNGQLCEMATEVLMANSPEFRQSIPRSLRNKDYSFKFRSPLHDAIERLKVGQFMEAQQVLTTAMSTDPSTRHIVDFGKATRDTLGAVIPAEWMRTEIDVESLVAADEEQAAQAQQLAALQQGADVAATLGQAMPTAGLGGLAGGAV